MAFKYELYPEEEKKLLAWFRNKDMSKYQGVIGGRFTYHFTPTTLGLIVKVSDSLDSDEIDLTDYHTWM